MKKSPTSRKETRQTSGGDRQPRQTTEPLPLTTIKDEPRIDSRLIAHQADVQHESVMRLLKDFAADFKEFGALIVKTFAAEFSDLKSGNSKRGRPEKAGLLNEDQSYLLLTYLRNSNQVRALKVRLVKSFRQARDAASMAKEYLPGYHALHDEVKHMAEVAKAAGSEAPERAFHINLNRLVNSVVGIPAGVRGSLAPEARLAVASVHVVAQRAIAGAISAGGNHHDAYQAAKSNVTRFARAMPLLMGDAA